MLLVFALLIINPMYVNASHKHSEGCYTIQGAHTHSGNATSGGGCYGTANYHVHSGDSINGGGCYAAYVSLRSGEAQQYHQEYLDRVEVLTGEDKVVELIPYSVKPYLLYFDDVTSNAYDWRNTAVARWYGKEQVYLRE